MNMFAAFCRAIDDGLFDEVDGADHNGEQRLEIATDPFVNEGTLTPDQVVKLAERLDQRKQEMPKAGEK